MNAFTLRALAWCVAAALLAPVAAARGPDPDVARLAQRLQAIAADPAQEGHAAFERLQAQQALDALAAAPGRQRDGALYVAERRVRIAEVAARTDAARAELARLDRQRSDLLVRASRQEAERARREAEQLRIQAQVQAEEAERLRQTAEQEAQARQQAEQVIDDVAGSQAARLAAARAREAELARQEAALMAGGSLPPASSDARGEVYTLAGDAFGSGSATLTASAAASVRALAAYLGNSARVRVEGHTDSQGEAGANQSLSQRRADAVKAALVAAGLRPSRITAVGLGEADPVADNATAAGRARNRRVEVVVVK